MRDLDLLNEYLFRLRQERLQSGHSQALGVHSDLLEIKVCAREAELCTRIRNAIAVLAKDPGQFMKEFLP